ncbi:hypothetical protein AFL01nite_04840 [Aeromicrobium flavum]|uniref:SF4 helicase domain-containing protein n=1 Tax=Aeromicrobium flavum TaxID=416568 RepID=A0A512HRT0_9ACTN|nr:hypothetical protein AFL01nite_04840 [Aeromicrobium flavum]
MRTPKVVKGLDCRRLTNLPLQRQPALILSDAAAMLLGMIPARQALGVVNDWKRDLAPVASTGFPLLDRCTGGFELGQVWVLTSRPGHGRSSFALGLALKAASGARWSTDFVSARDRLDVVSARLLATTARVPLHRLRHEDTSNEEASRIAAAVRELANVDLNLEGPREGASPEPTEGHADVTVIDDFHLTGYESLRMVRDHATRGRLFIVTVPRHLVLIDGELDPGWTEISDITVDIERPDATGAGESPRPGEADLRILHNRLGPQTTVPLAFQGQWSRFTPIH